MIEVKVDTREIESLVKKLTEKGDEMTEVVFEEIVTTTYAIEADAKRSCPVKTGRLRASITSKVDKKTLSGVVGTNVNYAGIVEFGSKALRRKAKPFLYPAYFNHVGELLEKLKAYGS